MKSTSTSWPIRGRNIAPQPCPAHAWLTRTQQVLRFLLLGGFAAAVNWLVRFPLSAFLPLSWAVLVAAMIGMTAGFVLYRRYVFPGSNRPIQLQIALFLVVNLVGAALVLGLTLLFLNVQATFSYPLWIQEGLAHGFAIGFGAISNFFGHRMLTFSIAHREANAA